MSIRLLTLALAAILLVACASIPAGKPDPRDHFERFNRAMFSFDQSLDRNVLLPVTRGYVKVVPKPVRRGISRFMTNIGYPRTIVNDALQAKFTDAGRDTLRLGINTLLGLGFWDPASSMGLEQHDEDFGQTLGKWGVHSGSYLVLPVLGPSTVRDAVGRVPDEYTTGRHYIRDSTVRWSIAAIDVVNSRAGLLDTDQVLNQSFDQYAFVRNAWLQRREYLVHDGNLPDEPLEPPDSP
jgi:phospholipid-binding lipoprotein MlaA